MTGPHRISLEQYARRRFTLSGTSVVKDHFPYCRPIDELGISRPGQDGCITSFAHYDYLGFEIDERVRDAAKRAIDDVGVGAGASRLVGGEHSSHRRLEEEIADFLGAEASLCLVSGYGTNVALISHLMTKDDLILVDEAAHNSIMVGTALSRAATVAFHHNDLTHLEALLLARRADHTRALVVVEGLYSMDGDIPDLPRLLALCRKHGAWLVVDEAHSIGVLGRAGRGITEHFGMAASEVDLIVGTLSKAFATCGGFIAGKQSVIDWLRFTLPGFVYSVGLTPPGVATAREAISILRREPERLRRLRDVSARFVAGARARGLDTGAAIGAAVVPIIFRDTPTAISAANTLLDAGFFVPPIVQIAVRRDAPRLRFFLTAHHTREHVDAVLDALSTYAERSASVAV